MAAGRPSWRNPINEPISTLTPIWHSRSYGPSSSKWATPPRVAKSGALVPTEERIRIYGPIQFSEWVGGASSEGDATTHGSSAFLFTHNVSHNGGMVLAPHVRRRLANYGSPGDDWGEMTIKNKSPFSPSQVPKKWGSGSQYMIKYGATLLDDIVYFNAESPSNRQEIIDFLHANGIYEIRGVKVEDRIGVNDPSADKIAKLIKQAQNAGYED